nr:hypothetical protein GCM10020092_036780 [Actinoplanes digitatis]
MVTLSRTYVSNVVVAGFSVGSMVTGKVVDSARSQARSGFSLSSTRSPPRASPVRTGLRSAGVPATVFFASHISGAGMRKVCSAGRAGQRDRTARVLLRRGRAGAAEREGDAGDLVDRGAVLDDEELLEALTGRLDHQVDARAGVHIGGPSPVDDRRGQRARPAHRDPVLARAHGGEVVLAVRLGPGDPQVARVGYGRHRAVRRGLQRLVDGDPGSVAAKALHARRDVRAELSVGQGVHLGRLRREAPDLDGLAGLTRRAQRHRLIRSRTQRSRGEILRRIARNSQQCDHDNGSTGCRKT